MNFVKDVTGGGPVSMIPNGFGVARLRMVTKVWRSTPFKIAVAFSVAIAVLTYGVFAFVSWRVASQGIAQVRTVLEFEAAHGSTVPIKEIEHELDLRLTHDLRRLDLVGLFDPSGSLIFGNAARDTMVPADGQAHLVEAPFGPTQAREPAIFVARRRPDGNILLLGRSLNEVYHLQAVVRLVFIAAILPVVLIALMTGIVVSRSALRRLASINEAINRVMQGELQARLPRRKKSDDINELVSSVNSMLDEIVRLINQLKSVGDNIAHDLKTPLAVMRARLERALDADSHEELVVATQAAMSNLDKALTTVTALLRISELESGMRRRAFSQVDLVEICQDVFDLYEALGQTKFITMTFQAPPPCMIFGDGDLLREAIANLLDNAVKFTLPGGSVTLECNCPDALIRVSDTGPGVPKGERDIIFKRFHRASTARGTAGVGLGLSMAATIVALHGYNFRIEDNHPGAIFEMVPLANTKY